METSIATRNKAIRSRTASNTLLALAAFVFIVAACSDAPHANRVGLSADRSRSAFRRAEAPCEALDIVPADVELAAGISLDRGHVLPGDPQTCEFRTHNGARLDLSIRPRIGRIAVDSWLSGRMPAPAIAISGVGDRAAWQPDLHEIIAEQDDLLCDATLLSDGAKASAPDSVPAPRLGALCSRIFASAAHRRATQPSPLSTKEIR